MSWKTEITDNGSPVYKPLHSIFQSIVTRHDIQAEQGWLVWKSQIITAYKADKCERTCNFFVTEKSQFVFPQNRCRAICFQTTGKGETFSMIEILKNIT